MMQQQMMQGGGGGGRDHSRSPRGHPAYKPPLPVCVDPSKLQSVDEFSKMNNLDAKCTENLKSQPLEVQHFVIGKGPAEGSNPSAMVTARIAKCAAEYTIHDASG